MLSKTVTALSVFFILVVFVTSAVIAGSNYEFKTKVDHRASFWEKVSEKINLFTKFNKVGKAKYWRELIDTRFAEIKYAVDGSRLGDIEDMTSRYSTYLGYYSEFLIKNNLSSEKEITLSMFGKHSEILKGLQQKYEFDSAWWMLIEHDINTLVIFKDKIQKL